MKLNISKPIKTFIFFFILGAVAIVAYAMGAGVFNKSFVVNPNYTYSYDLELENADVAATDLLPGQSVSIQPKIISKSTGNSYVFMRIECGSVNEQPIYSFTDEDGLWTVVKTEPDAILAVYGTSTACSEFTPGQEIDVNGKLTLSLDYAQYADLAGSEDPLKFTVTVCGIHSEDVEALGLAAPKSNPLEAYAQYEQEVGE